MRDWISDTDGWNFFIMSTSKEPDGSFARNPVLGGAHFNSNAPRHTSDWKLKGLALSSTKPHFRALQLKTM